jgi:hypothetical protein
VDLHVAGLGNAITMNGGTLVAAAGSSLSLTGHHDFVSGAANVTLDVAGAADTVTLSDATIRIAAGSTVALTGDRDTIVAATASSLTLSGNSDTTTAGDGATITVIVTQCRPSRAWSDACASRSVRRPSRSGWRT